MGIASETGRRMNRAVSSPRLATLKCRYKPFTYACTVCGLTPSRLAISFSLSPASRRCKVCTCRGERPAVSERGGLIVSPSERHQSASNLRCA